MPNPDVEYPDFNALQLAWLNGKCTIHEMLQDIYDMGYQAGADAQS